MKVAIYLGHPAHFHLFNYTAKNLVSSGHTVSFVIKQKDILKDLLQNAGFKYVTIREEERKKSSKLGLMFSLIKMDFKMLRFLLKDRPDILIGTYVALLGKLSGVPIISINEDDASAVPMFAFTSYPLANAILNPTVCNSGRWEKKAIKYHGYQKLAYLHPNQFTPNKEIADQYIDTSKPYFIMRFAKLNAHHDKNVIGITDYIALRLVDILKPHGNVYITSERALNQGLEQKRLVINPLHIHHIMAFATLYIGDSQSMAVEAAMLGIPNIRFNDFVGKIGVLNEIEEVYGLYT